MVMTVLEAKVKPEQWNLLRQTYKTLTGEIPPEIKASYLVQDQKDESIWRIVTIWESQQALIAMRSSGKTPVGVVIFNKAGASPELSVYSIEEKTTKTFS